MTRKIGEDKAARSEARAFETNMGAAGELHQVTSGSEEVLTTRRGVPATPLPR